MRYGENILEVEKIGNWTCPVCRGLCNCSNHRIRRGWAPTGSLFRRAVAEGECLMPLHMMNLVCLISIEVAEALTCSMLLSTSHGFWTANLN